jgi:RNA polymerase sigma-70 factor (ECF subfamily)
MPDECNLTAASDEQLVAATLQGDISSFGIIVERYWNMAVALALSKIDDLVAAEDVAQESFIKAYSQLHRLRKASSFAGWLSKIIAQQCVNTLRRKERNEIISSYETPSPEVLNFALAKSTNPGLTDEQTLFVRRVIRNLPEKFRKIIIMRFVAGLPAVQIAKQLGKRPGTVRVWLHRTYQILRKDLAPILEELE